jgi:Rod binding domain-containing protein
MSIAIGSSMMPETKPTQLNGGAKTTATDPRSEAIQKKREDAEKVAQDFETMFVDLMVKSMRQTAQPEDTSNAEDVYQGMLDSEYSKSMTATQSFGIRAQVLNWLEQTDPDLKLKSPADNAKTDDKSILSERKIDTASLQNEALALKAATQAYRLSSAPR